MASVLRRILGRRGVRKKRLRVRPRQMRRRRAAAHTPGEDDARIQRFRGWCAEVGIWLHPSLYIGREGSCADIGVVAQSGIPAGSVLARIPRSSLLTAANCQPLGAAILQDRVLRRQMKTTNNSWIPLLLALLAETGRKSSSFWWPYLSLVSSEKSPGPTPQWSQTERSQLLQGTGVEGRVQQDLADIDRDYRNIVLPFIQRHPQLYQGSESDYCLQRYRDLVCFVMSYSFTDSEERDASRQTMMVPFVDLLNHSSHHHSQLSFHSSHLQLVAVTDISQGAEVMNTYGPLSNASLLHLYGFTEEGNPHDVALIQGTTLWEVYTSTGGSHDVSCDQRWTRVREDVSSDEFEVSISGSPEPSLIAVVKLLMVEKDKYDIMQNYVMDEEVDLDVESMSQREREFLKKVCQASLAELPNVSCGGGGCRQDKKYFALQLASRQRLCLEKLEKATTGVYICE